MQNVLMRSFFNVADWAYTSDDSFVKRWRTERFRAFLECVNPPQGARIIDLGGSPWMWELMEHDFQVTIVNLPGNEQQGASSKRFTYIEADATDLGQIFKDRSFDVAYSNSVIEHVGDASKQAAFAAEVYRLGKAFWVQTPSDRFPIEVHTGVPFYWKLPEFVRTELKKYWRRYSEGWTDMVEGTRVLSRRQMKALFPNAAVYVERRLLLEKSYAMYCPFRREV